MQRSTRACGLCDTVLQLDSGRAKDCECRSFPPISSRTLGGFGAAHWPCRHGRPLALARGIGEPHHAGADADGLRALPLLLCLRGVPSRRVRGALDRASYGWRVHRYGVLRELPIC